MSKLSTTISIRLKVDTLLALEELRVYTKNDEKTLNAYIVTILENHTSDSTMERVNRRKTKK